MSKAIKRLIADYIDLENNKLDNIFTYYDESNIFILYALIIGQENTPYEGGFFYFKLIFDESYPTKPPKCTFETINGTIRFNPNLYENGKICLSILGTWSGPGWKPVMNTRSILLNFQSLLHEYPIINEPMYNNLNVNDKRSLNYNKILRYYTFKFAILEIYNKRKSFYPWFKSIIENNFKKNCNKYLIELINLKENFNGEYIEIYPWTHNNTTLNYCELLKIYENIINHN